MSRHQFIRASEPRLTPAVDRIFLLVAIVLMLGGAGMLVADVLSPGLAIPLIAIGIAFVAIDRLAKRRE